MPTPVPHWVRIAVWTAIFLAVGGWAWMNDKWPDSPTQRLLIVLALLFLAGELMM
jgi:hypothetical protein